MVGLFLKDAVLPAQSPMLSLLPLYTIYYQYLQFYVLFSSISFVGENILQSVECVYTCGGWDGTDFVTAV